jgi:hypothetical protein
VQYRVASHNDDDDRRGSITVAGRNFRIDQEEDD